MVILPPGPDPDSGSVGQAGSAAPRPSVGDCFPSAQPRHELKSLRKRAKLLGFELVNYSTGEVTHRFLDRSANRDHESRYFQDDYPLTCRHLSIQNNVLSRRRENINFYQPQKFELFSAKLFAIWEGANAPNICLTAAFRLDGATWNPMKCTLP